MARDGGDGVLATTSLLGLRCKLFEVPSRYGHQFGNTGQIPIGVGHLGMSDIGRQRHHRVINRDALQMPLQDTPTDKRMSIMPLAA